MSDLDRWLGDLGEPPLGVREAIGDELMGMVAAATDGRKGNWPVKI